MKLKENERGGALLMVLMLVVVFTVLGVGMLSMNSSASKQFDKKEEQVQARHQAEMGILHYKAEVEKMIEDYSNNTQVNQLSGDFCDDITGIPQIINDLCQNLNQIVVNSIDGYDAVLNNISYNNDELSVGITSTGFAGKEKKKVDGTIVVVAPVEEVGNSGIDDEDDVTQPSQPTGEVTVEQGPYEIKNGTFEIEGSLHVKKPGNLIVEPGNNNNGADITIGGDLYVEDGMQIPNHTCMIVEGDFTVLGNIDTLKAHTYIIVYGNAYVNKKLNIKNKAGFYVNGQVTIGGKIDYTAYKNLSSIPIDCKRWMSLPEPKEIILDWFVKPDVNPEYR